MTDTTPQPKPEKKLPESTTSNSKSADQTASSARFVNGKIIPNRLTGLMIGLIAVTLSVFGLLLYVQAVQQPQTAESEAQGMPPGVAEMGSVWLEATTSENGTVADVAVYASSTTNIQQATASIEWDSAQAYYDIETPAAQNSGLHCSGDGRYIPEYNISYGGVGTGGQGGNVWVSFMGLANEYCDSYNENRAFDWDRALPAGDRIPIGSFRIRSRVTGVVPLNLVFLTSISNEASIQAGNPGNVNMAGTSVSMTAASTPPGTPIPRPTSVTERETHVLNSASGQSCDQLCGEQGLWCHSIGLKTEPITGINEFRGLGGSYVYWDSGLGPEQPDKCRIANSCGSGPPAGMPIGYVIPPNTNYCGDFWDASNNVRPGGGDCGAVMTDSDPYQTCSNASVPGVNTVGNEGNEETYRTPWTYCYCKSGARPTPRPPANVQMYPVDVCLPMNWQPGDPIPPSTAGGDCGGMSSKPPNLEITPITRASGTTTCECPLDHACSPDGQSCVNVIKHGQPCPVPYSLDTCRLFCEDGTPIGQCSPYQPWSCDGSLVQNCGVCGCPDGYECNTYKPELVMQAFQDWVVVPHSVHSRIIGTCTPKEVARCGPAEDPLRYRDQCLPGAAPAYCQKWIFPGLETKEHIFVEIVNNCQKCGCPAGQNCGADGNCAGGTSFYPKPGQSCELGSGVVDGRLTGGLKCTGSYNVPAIYANQSLNPPAVPTQPTRPYVPDPITSTIAPGDPTAAPVPPALTSQTDVKGLEEFIEILRNPSLLESFISFLRLLGSLFGGASN